MTAATPLTRQQMGLAIVFLLLMLLLQPPPPLVVVVDVIVGRWRSRRQVGFIIAMMVVVIVVEVVVVVVIVVIVGILVADQCRGHTNTSSCTQTHPGTALIHTYIKHNMYQHFIEMISSLF